MMEKRKGMIPEQLRSPWPLVPCCILSLTLGLFLLSFLLFPGYYPDITDRIAAGHLMANITIIGLFCVSLPISLLYLATLKKRPS